MTNKAHGLLFDCGVITYNIFFLGAGAETVENPSDRTAGVLLMVAIITQVTGALLKMGPLQQRLAESRQHHSARSKERFLDCMSFLHFLLFLIIATMSLFGLLGPYYSGTAARQTWEAISVLGAAIIGGVTTYVVRRAASGSRQNPNARYWLPAIEYAADLLLLVSVSIIARFFWDTWHQLIEPATGAGLSVAGLITLAGSLMIFVFFYVPSRFLFLAEDYPYPGTWFRLSLAMLPLAWRVVVG